MRQRAITFFPSRKLCDALRRLQVACNVAAHHDEHTIAVRRTDVKRVVELFDADLLDEPQASAATIAPDGAEG